MLQKKVCLLGSFAVGKTSLVARFVRSIFSEKYLTTVGVKIDQKVLEVGDQQLKLVLWDMHGEDDFQKLRRSYLRGAAGCIFVVDGTRPATLDVALSLSEVVRDELGRDPPALLLLNKSDLEEEWALDEGRVEALEGDGWSVLRTSAKTGIGVEEAFHTISQRMLGVGDGRLPSPVLEYLERSCVQDRAPAYMQISAEGQLESSGGALTRYGLGELLPGLRVEECVSFLAGLLPVRERVQLPCINWGPGLRVDLHGFPSGGSTWLLLLDAEPGASHQQRLQQRHNEVLLEREEEQRLSDSLFVALESMGLVLLEPSGPTSFRALSRFPLWCHALWPDAGDEEALEPGARFPFIEHFLGDARAFWEDPAPEQEQLRSGPWIEVDPRGQEIALEATATRAGRQRLLTIERLGSAFEERSRELQAARATSLLYERLKREIELKDILSHCIVHDLSGPLTSMQGAFGLLGEDSLEPALQTELIEIGLSAAKQQGEMIRDILRVFAAEQQDLHGDGSGTTELVASVAAVERSLAPAFQRKAVRLVRQENDAAAGVRVRGESSRLERVISNLLENALRYAPRDSCVTVSVASEDDSLRVAIDDEGPGIDPQTSRQLFRKFSQGKGAQGKVGLGLYFCRITVERWGGEIGCQPRAEGGTRFWFRLRREPSRS